jgi:hypothetical protein
MDQDPLVGEQLDAGAKFIGEFNNYAPVGAAFWLKESDSGHWYLYIASDRLDGEKIADAYGEVLRLNKELADPNFDPFQVKLISLDHPLAKAARELYRGRPWKFPTRYHGRIFGGASTDEVYIYAPPLTVPAQ